MDMYLERLPETTGLVATVAFLVEAVDTINGGAFVIPTEHEKVLGIFDLETEEETDRLNILPAAIHIVAEEEIVCLGREAVLVEDSQKVRELAVNVATDDERRRYFHQRRLRHEDLFCFEAEGLKFLIVDAGRQTLRSHVQ